MCDGAVTCELWLHSWQVKHVGVIWCKIMKNCSGKYLCDKSLMGCGCVAVCGCLWGGARAERPCACPRSDDEAWAAIYDNVSLRKWV